jgi:hypothetical protein
VPGAYRALVLANHGRLQHLRERLSAPGVRRCGHREDGVALVGERRGAAASLTRGLGDLPHFRLGYQDHVEGDLT